MSIRIEIVIPDHIIYEDGVVAHMKALGFSRNGTIPAVQSPPADAVNLSHAYNHNDTVSISESPSTGAIASVDTIERRGYGAVDG